MSTQLQRNLFRIAPRLTIETLWDPDQDGPRDIRRDCCGFEDENPLDWQAWQSEIKVEVELEDEKLSSSTYLGGIWERVENDPWKSNSDISGYELQMTEEALVELKEKVVKSGHSTEELDLALDFIERALQREVTVSN